MNCVCVSLMACALSALPSSSSFAGQTPHDRSLFAYYTSVATSEAWLRHSRTGRYADVIVDVGRLGELVFARGSSYLPYWKTDRGQWTLPEVVPRRGDGPPQQPDRLNRYSYVRIIEQDPTQVIVHWRYRPDFANLSWSGVVDEYFHVRPDGTIRRTIRVGTAKIDEWNDPASKAVHILSLRTDGVTSQKVVEPERSAEVRPGREMAVPTPLAPVASGQREGIEKPSGKSRPNTATDGVEPDLFWPFDDGLTERTDFATETRRGVPCQITGHQGLWKRGVSGASLAFDGYYSSVVMPAARMPQARTMLTLEAWVALGAYPFEWAPVIHQSHWQESGYYLGVDQQGHLGFHAKVGDRWQSLVDTAALELFRWHHVAASFDGESGVIKLFVNGRKRATRNDASGQLQLADCDLVMGLNNQKMPHRSGRVRLGKWPSMVGFDGLIDEVRFHSKALEEKEVLESFEQSRPDEAAIRAPDLMARRFPAHPRGQAAEAFGATYSRLSYYDTWDNFWRVSDHPDVVVKFDRSPTRFVFWRGLSYGVGLVTENGKWAGDQSSENYKELGADDAEGCCEHMSDKQCRHSHVRIIENTDARVVVHWRYGMVDSRYRFPDVDLQTGWGDWADEYWTIYPDAVAVRHLERGFIWGDSWVETMFYNEPGTLPEDNVELAAYTLVSRNGEVENYSWESGSPECDLDAPVVALINMRSQWKPFNVYPTGSSVETFGGSSRLSRFHCWNHYPVSQITSDGRGARSADRASHSSLVWGTPSTNYLLYGLTNKAPQKLLPLANSWNTPPGLVNATGAHLQGYRPQERAYHLTATAPSITFQALASEERPLVNPCFVIEGWTSPATVQLLIDGKPCQNGARFRHGSTYNTLGQLRHIVWVDLQREEIVKLQISAGR